jgi:hypothetical protein
MRIRCSRGLKVSSFYGHFFIRSTDLLALPNVDTDKAFAVQFSHEEGGLTGRTCCFQVVRLLHFLASISLCIILSDTAFTANETGTAVYQLFRRATHSRFDFATSDIDHSRRNVSARGRGRLYQSDDAHCY